ncbi:MAG: glycosyltransferase [Burkholderiales bacterium]
MEKPSMQSPIVVHCHLRWDFVWQRPQQIFSRLAAEQRVLFLEEPCYEGTQATLRLTEPQPGIVRVVPILPERMPVDDECAIVLPLVRAALERHPLLAGEFDSPIQWFYSPMTAPDFIGQLGETCVVYDCMDELANFRFAPPDIQEREAFLLQHADVVFTGGQQLFEAKSRRHRNVHFYGCGVDAAHFARARSEATPVPSALAKLPRPVLGYFGVIDERLDYPLIARLAEAFPEGSVAMVGPLAKVNAAELPQAPNLHWLGQQSYAALPGFVKGFDICLMPFALNEATRYINPTKTLEYMAAGKPIVSTAVPDVVRQFSSIVELADSREDFVRGVSRAVAAPRPDVIAHGIERAERSTWEAIVAAMRRDVMAVLGQTARAAA